MRGQLLQLIEQSNRYYDGAVSAAYRKQDEAALAAGGARAHYAESIRNISQSFERKIDVLDVGCGTGRYFHSLRNVRRLVGIDTSPHMIEQAHNPARKDALDVQTIELSCVDVFSLAEPMGSFDFIYSTGVFGEVARLDTLLLQRFANLLRPDGVIFTTAVDARSRVMERVNGRVTLTRRVLRKLVFRYLPPAIRVALNRHLSPCYVTREQLEATFAASPFPIYTIVPYEHSSGWRGTHFDCTACYSEHVAARLQMTQ